MSPAQFNDDLQARREMMNGPRPSPLKISKDSHLIHKPSSSSSSSSTTSSFLTKQQQRHPTQLHQQRHPVIIYTHSPKIIHTQARDFMALVQKLTGLSKDQAVQPPSLETIQDSSSEGNTNTRAIGHDDTPSSSVVTDDNRGGVGDVQVSSSSVSPLFDPPNPYFSDIPLFTPNSSDFFCSPRPFYRYPDSLFASPNMANSISPSVLEVMKGFQDY